jgi:hypothetical protein
MASSSPAPDAATLCPSCGTPAAGKFCSNCAAPLAGATCLACNAPLSPGAKYCHRCGTRVGSDAAPILRDNGSNIVPWSIAGISLLAVIAFIAAQRFSGGNSASPQDAAPQQAEASAPAGAAAGQPPDISNLTPAEAAVRLYNRVMGQHERGKADSVQLFAPMAIAAYQQLGTLDLDQRYDVGRIAAVSGDEPLARAEADSILAKNPNHLLGLILAGNAARLRKDSVAERRFHDKFLAAATAERAKQLPEYVTHENDIAIALEAKAP